MLSLRENLYDKEKKSLLLGFEIKLFLGILIVNSQIGKKVYENFKACKKKETASRDSLNYSGLRLRRWEILHTFLIREAEARVGEARA